MKREEVHRLLRERDELVSLLDVAGCDLHGWDHLESASGIDRSDGRLYSFGRPHFRALRELREFRKESVKAAEVDQTSEIG